mgnify:CR=1 FL=1
MPPWKEINTASISTGLSSSISAQVGNRSFTVINALWSQSNGSGCCRSGNITVFITSKGDIDAGVQDEELGELSGQSHGAAEGGKNR